MDDDDRLSQLPQHILQNHILSLLPQNDAVGTCTLSKSWRHLGLTLPKFEFKEGNFGGTKQEFLSVVGKTLQRYDDQNLSIQEFVLDVSVPKDSKSVSLLNKWIPKVITNMGVKMFNLTAYDFALPSVVFQAEFLVELVLQGCKLNYQINNNCIINVKLHMLKRLELRQVRIEDETFEKIMSSCPLIQHLVLRSCHGLSRVKVNKAPNLKHFNCQFVGNDEKSSDSIEIEDASSLETIRIVDCDSWYHHNNKSNDYFFPRLKSLFLLCVHVPTELLNNLTSDNCPCLEQLQLHDCSGFKEFELSNCSIKRLIIVVRSCHGLSDVKVNKVCNLKHFYCQFSGEDEYSSRDSIEIEDAPSLETIRIEDCKNWYHLHNNNYYFFPRLKSLYLCRVDLPTELLNNLLSNCPSLEELQLHDCRGFSEFKLSSRSLQRLIIDIHSRPIKADIDAANMLYFQFGGFLPCISFTTTSREWKSRVHVGRPYSNADALSTWLLKLKEFLKALSQSQISLEIYGFSLTNQDTCDIGGRCEPVVVEHLFFGQHLSSSTIPGLLNCLFRICRPRYIGVPSFTPFCSSLGQHAKYTWMTLKGETKESKFWKQDLEESSIQVLDENTKEWSSVKVCSVPKDENIRFRLKWRDSSEIALVH